MTLPPITIPQLDPAGPTDPQNDLMLIRQGFNDRRITLGQVLTIRLASLSYLPSALTQNDVVLVGRPSGGEYTNYLLRPQNIGFLQGTKMWFWQSSAPLGWTLVQNQGDRLLATGVQGGANYQYKSTSRGNFAGTWQQEGHAISIEQMPAHNHDIRVNRPSTDRENELVWYNAATIHSELKRVYDNAVQSTGGGLPHDHGFTWRPAALVGVLCEKDQNYPIG